MKPPQTRSTAVDIENTENKSTTRVPPVSQTTTGTQPASLEVESKYLMDHSYSTFVILEGREAVEVFRDVVQYILASYDSSYNMPERYNNVIPVPERQRAFTERHDGFNINSYDSVEKIKVTSPSGPSRLVEIRAPREDGDAPAPIFISELAELERLRDVCNSWLEYQTSQV